MTLLIHINFIFTMSIWFFFILEKHKLYWSAHAIKGLSLVLYKEEECNLILWKTESSRYFWTAAIPPFELKNDIRIVQNYIILDIFIGPNLLQNRQNNDRFKKMKDCVSGIKVCHNIGMEQKFNSIISQLFSRHHRFLFWKGNNVEKF